MPGPDVAVNARAPFQLAPSTMPIDTAIGKALAFNPLRLRLQRRVEVAMYGTRRDPFKAASAVGQRLTGDPALPSGVLISIVDADGELYLIGANNTIYKIVRAGG